MIDIFNKYNTGDREWTFARKRFTESEFREAFRRLLPNDILHDAALAFLHTTHIDVVSFSVPMANQVAHTNFRRNVLFIQRPGSDYFTMFSFMWIQREATVEGLTRAFAENSHIGNMSEYAILDMIEPMNEGHQWALMETWFDIDNWFEILRIHNLEVNRDIDAIERITNGIAPRELNARADEFVPELAHVWQQQQQEQERDDWMQPPPDFQQPHADAGAWDVRMLLPENNVNVIPFPRRQNIV